MSRLAWAAVAVVAIAVAALAGAWLLRLEIATRAIQRVLEERGIPSPRLRVSALGAHAVTIRGLRLGASGELEVSRLRARFAWWGERVGVEAIELEGARVTLDLREGHTALGSLQGPLESLLAPAEPLQPAPIPSVLVPPMRIARSKLRLVTDESTIELAVDLDLDPDEQSDAPTLAGRLALSTDAAVWNGMRMAGASLSLPLRITPGPPVTTVAWQDGAFVFSELQAPPVALDEPTTVRLPGGRLTLLGPDDAPALAHVTSEIEVSALHVHRSEDVPEVALRAFAGSVAGNVVDGGFVGSLALRVPSIDLVAERVALRDVALDVPLPLSASPLKLSKVVVTDLDSVQRFPTLELSASLSPPELDSPWKAEGEFRMAAGQLRGALRATMDPQSNAGDVRVQLASVRFRRGGLQPETIHPGLGFLGDVAGRLDANGELAWNATGVSSSQAWIALTGVSFRGPTAQVEDLRAGLHLTSLLPLRSAPHQDLRAASLQTGGLRFGDVRARFQLQTATGASSPRLHVEAASLRLGQGVLRVLDATLDPGAPRELTIRAEGVRLEELFRLLDVAAVAGTGSISGAIPVKIEDEAVQIRDGVLESDGPGVLNVRSDFARSVLESAGKPAALVGRALEDFHYERLRITIDKPFQGTSQLGINALGMNPVVLEGQPFDLHINVETDLEPLLRAASLGLRIPGEWSRHEPGPSR